MLYTVLLHQPTDGSGRPSKEAVQSIVANTIFQNALLAVTVEVVLFAASGQADFPALTAKLGLLANAFDMWEALLYMKLLLQKVNPIFSHYFILNSSC